MSKRYAEWCNRYEYAALAAGLTIEQAEQLRRDAERIDTWNTHECNGTIQWAEAGQLDHRGRTLKAGRPYWVTGQDDPKCERPRWYPRSDTYTPAVARVDALAASIGAKVDHNGDPRGLPFTFIMPDGRTFAPPIREGK